MAKAHDFKRHRLKMFRASMISISQFAPTNSDFVHVFLDNSFSWRRIFLKTHLSQRKWLFHQNYAEKNIGHRVPLGENDLLFLWQAQSHRETAMLSMCAHYERELMTQEIVRSEDVQCNTEESP